MTALYIFNCKGKGRIQGEEGRREGDNIFEQGTRTSIVVSFLIKNSGSKREKGVIKYFDIGDYLSREKKLEKIRSAESIESINWKTIEPNKYGDWIHQRNENLEKFIPMGSKTKEEKAVFKLFSNGVVTNRRQLGL